MLDHKYIIFYHLAKTPNTTKVAEELLLTQPAISKSIRELEKELGITLFHRNKGRMQLTEAGQFLFKETEELVRKEREIKFGLDQMRERFNGTLHLGASTTLSQYVLPEILAGFNNHYPEIQISMLSGNTAQIEQEILAGNLQLAFIEGTPNQPDIHYIPYLQDEIVLVSAGRTSLPECIPARRLADLPLIFREKGSGTYNIISRQLRNAGIDIRQLRRVLTIGTTEGIKNYLLHSDCFALLSVYSIRDELASGKLVITDLEDLSINRMFYIIHRQGEPDPYARQFMEFVSGKKIR